MAMTYATLKYLTQYLIGDPQTSTYSEQMYQDSINFALKDYAIKTGVTYLETPSIVPDAAGLCIIPVDYLKINRVYHMVGGTTLTELVESTLSFESQKSPTWQTLSGLPKRWLLWAGDKVKITPIPNPVYTVTVGYVQEPADMLSSVPSATIESRIPAAHHEYLKYAACTWLALIDGDSLDIGKAEKFMGIFNDLIGYTDPVLELKRKQARTQAEREV